MLVDGNGLDVGRRCIVDEKTLGSWTCAGAGYGLGRVSYRCGITSGGERTEAQSMSKSSLVLMVVVGRVGGELVVER